MGTFGKLFYLIYSPYLRPARSPADPRVNAGGRCIDRLLTTSTAVGSAYAHLRINNSAAARPIILPRVVTNTGFASSDVMASTASAGLLYSLSRSQYCGRRIDGCRCRLFCWLHDQSPGTLCRTKKRYISSYFTPNSLIEIAATALTNSLLRHGSRVLFSFVDPSSAAVVRATRKGQSMPHDSSAP